MEEGGPSLKGVVSAESQKEASTKTEIHKEITEAVAGPAARKMAEQQGIDLAKVVGSGKKGLITKEDVQSYQQPTAKVMNNASSSGDSSTVVSSMDEVSSVGNRVEKRVPMTRLRKRIAERLLEASSSTAMLTTFNEVDMSQMMALRKKYGVQFEKSHEGIRLGFMGFFVKAAAEALKRFPAVNASIDNNDIVYHGYQDIGVAVSTEKGLVVPVLRNAEYMGLAEIERTIRNFATRARDGKLGIDEMTGGTFTITNGGVFGSLLSTPILNPPQTAILGMHKTQDRPVAVDGEVKILPMMYLALSYDHRLIDGKEAVQFLVAIKDMLEDPARMILEL
jgi:2-oxoglutarate dehydrogenase E2 component (dihydrolipoamide succinyltransferase)